MSSCAYKRIAVKIGSNVLTCTDGTLDTDNLSSLVNQIAELHKQNVEIVLISSGAVASGQSEFHTDKKLNSVERRQLLSAIGQAKLINRYYDLFREHHITVGQVLTTKESLATRRHYLNQKACMEAMWNCGVIPIVNENDTISVTELMFTDNDELGGLIAGMMNAEALILLSNIDGLFDGDPTASGSKVIRQIEPGKELGHCIQPGKSDFGRGGMLTKTHIARKVADEGIHVFIANGKRKDILLQLLHAPGETLCTHFIPARPRPMSNVKKWIAHSDSFAKGSIHINEKAAETIRDETAASILPVGVTRIEGEFEKDDIVRIIDASGRHIGVGKAACSSQTARKTIGRHRQKPLVHYDYLYIE